MSRFHIDAPLLIFTLIVLAATPIFAQPQRDIYNQYEIEYDWLEILDIGDPIVDFRDNEFRGPFAIGYPFPFYGEVYEEFYISSNGIIGFGPVVGYGSYDNTEFPDADAPNNFIGLYWKNLDPDMFWADGMVYKGIRDGKRIIQFEGIAERNLDGTAPENTITMQVILERDGDVILQYKEVGEEFDLETGTIGMEGPNGEEGITLRHNGEGIDIADETAYLISDHGPGDFLVWDAGTDTESGNAQEEALLALEHTVTHLRPDMGDEGRLPEDLQDYEAVFVNLGNYGVNGNHYHQLTVEEGQILADYLRAGGAVYMEGSDTWNTDPAREVHPFFHIRGLDDGNRLEPPVSGIDGSIVEDIGFDDYQAEHNDFVDHLQGIDGGSEWFSFMEGDDAYVGMVAFWGEEYRTIGSSFEFGGLVDGDAGTKEELMSRMIEFFRASPPEFLPPLNLRALSGDQEVTLQWDHPRRVDRLMNLREMQIEREISQLTSNKHDQKPTTENRERLRELQTQLRVIRQQNDNAPHRDEVVGFRIYVNGEEYDFTNALEYTVIELQNNEEYVFHVRAVYDDPEGESEPAGPVAAVPTAIVNPGWTADFEEFNGALSPIPGEGGWQWGHPEIGAAEGENAWGTILDGPYPNDAHYELHLPMMNLEGVEQVWFDLEHYMDSEEGWDGGNVMISSDGGERWELLTPIGGYTAEDIFALNPPAGFTATFEDWQFLRFNLTPYADETVQIKFVFASDQSNFRPYNGWYIDNLRLYEPELGSVRVQVLDDIDEEPIEQADVTLVGLGTQLTNFDGVTIFNNVPVGQWTVRIEAPGYLIAEDNVDVIADELINREFYLLRWDSDLAVDPDNIVEELQFDGQSQRQVTLTNNGEQETSYKVYIDYFAGMNRAQHNAPFNNRIQDVDAGVPDRDDPWDLVQTYQITEETGEEFFIGAEFIRTDDGNLHGPQNYRLIAGAGDFQSGDCRFYKFNRDGTFNSFIPQNHFSIDDWGLRDLAYDGFELYGSKDEDIFVMNPNTGARNMFFEGAPLNIHRAIAWVPEEDAFWVGDWDDSWFKLDDNGDILDRNTQHGLTGVTGMAWNPSDPDGYNLYIHNQEPDDGGAAVYRYNPETRDLQRQLTTAEAGEGYAGGLFVTYLYDTHTWHLGALIQGVEGQGDVVKLYELWPHDSWISVTPTAGDLAGGAQSQLTVSFEAEGIYDEIRSAIIVIEDQMTLEATEILCELTVLNGPASLSGQVTINEGDGDPQAVTVTLADVDNPWNISVTNPDGEGLYEFARIIPGNYIITAELADYHTFVSDPFGVEPDEEIVDFNIELEPVLMGLLSGVVYDVNNEDIPELEGVEITAFKLDDEQIFFAETDDMGEFNIELPVGTYDVTAYKPTYGSMTLADVEILADEQAFLEFELDDRGGVRALHVNGNYDDRITLSWLPPGYNGDAVQIVYHDGMLSNGIYLINRDDELAVRYEPEGVYDILRLEAYTVSRRDELNGEDNWPDWNMDEYMLRVYDEDPDTGFPGELLFEQRMSDRLRDDDPRWDTLNVADEEELRYREGAFFLAWSQYEFENGVEAVGLDDSYDNQGTTYIKFDGEWREYDQIPGDQIMGVLIWDHYLDDEQQAIPQPNGAQNLVQLQQQEVPASVRLMNPSAPSYAVGNVPYDAGWIYDRYAPPTRDVLLGYNVYANGEILNRDLIDPQETSWIHFVMSNNEDVEYLYAVGAVFPGEDEEVVEYDFEGPDGEGNPIPGRANMAPGQIRNMSVSTDGLSYRVEWDAPWVNEDGTNLIDYAGCQIHLDNELIATVMAPEDWVPDDLFYEGEIEEGQEGWHTFQLNAIDEVPNVSAPLVQDAALGLAAVEDFETNRVVFRTTPAGAWGRSSVMNNGPGEAHSGRWAWATRAANGEYEDDAEWYIETANEYHVVSDNARMDFFHYISTETGHDGGQVQIAVNGDDWQMITPDGDYPDQNVAGLNNTPGFTGSNNTWQLATFNLGQYEDALVKFRFKFGSDRTIHNYPGWYLDDLVLWGCDALEYGTVFGIVRDQEGTPVEDANITDGRRVVQSDINGMYQLSNVLPGENEITISKAGYVSVSEMVMIDPENDDNNGFVNLDVDLTEARIRPDPDAFDFVLGGNEQLEIHFDITNLIGDDLPYWIRVVSNPEGNRDDVSRTARALNTNGPYRDDPWDVAFDHNLTETTMHTRIMGVEFVGDHFYVTTADPNHGTKVLVLDWQGNLVRFFDQPVDVRGWGLRDLAWDGENLYGSQNDRIYGFDTQGELVSEQAGAPMTLNRALAYDPENDAFWTAEWESAWYQVNRQGEVVTTWDEHGLDGVYGMAYHPGDTENMPLYVFNLEDNGSTGIYRANPQAGEIEQMLEVAGAPTGCFITSEWDENRWILGGVVGNQQQHLVGYELNRHVGFISVDPPNGVLGGEENQEFIATVTVPRDAEQGDIYNGSVTFRSLGTAIAEIPFRLEVVEGFRHFDDPPVSDHFHTVTIQAAQHFGRDLPIGSEVAVFTPDDNLAGVARWLDEGSELLAYQGDEAFNQGDEFRFMIWVSDVDREYETVIEFLDGPRVFRVGGETTINLMIEAEDEQRVELQRRWNLVSTYVQPAEPMVSDVLAGVNDRGHLIIAKDGLGRFWWPEMNFNGLDEWDVLGGYQVNVSVDESFTVVGERLPENTPIPLRRNWNTISYLLSDVVESRIAFGNILEEMILAKNGQGDFMVPEFGFFGLGELVPGQGYKVKMREDVELVYQREEDGLAFGSNMEMQFDHQLPVTGSDMSVLINRIDGEMLPNRIIQVYGSESNQLIGRQTLTELPCGVILRGDDNSTSEVDGAIEGEGLRLELVDALTGAVTKVEVSNSKNLTYETDDFRLIDLQLSVAEIPSEFHIASVYPNPFNARTKVTFAVPDNSIVFGELRNINGQQVMQIEEQRFTAGWHEITIDGKDLSSGIYLLQLRSRNATIQTKIILLQ